jgi:hypothetical protein
MDVQSHFGLNKLPFTPEIRPAALHSRDSA